MVIAVGPGREDPPIVGEVGVALFEPRKLAISWLGSSCDANSLLVVGRMAGELDVRIDRGLRGDECAPAEVIYEIVLELSTDVSEDQVKARLGP
jgi:hypothetical protein